MGLTFAEVLEKSKKDNKYINKELLNVSEENIPIKDFRESTLDDYKYFDENSWNKGDGYSFPNYPMITERLEGLDEGLYLVAGESNTGKSAFMLNVIYDLCTNKDNKLFGIYYSLDDTKYDIIPRIIAMDQSIPIGLVAKPKRFQNMINNGEENTYVYEEQLKKRQEGLDKLKELNDCFKIEDGSTIKSAEDMFKHMKQLQHYVKTIDPDMNIVVAIDAVDDIRFAGKHFGTTTDRHAEIARTIKEWSTELHIPIFGSRHLSKLRQNRRPTLDDLKDSNEYVYEASVVWLVHNDVSKNKQAANIYTSDESGASPEKFPVLEIDWAKNKKSSFKGRTYAYFIPNLSKATECGIDASKRYDSQIYSM